MRVSLAWFLMVGLLLGGGCSRFESPETAAPKPAPPAAAAAKPAVSAPAEPAFGVAELHQLVAPIALYPDALLAQVLMASTYPGDVAEAVAWSKAHPDATGDGAIRQVAGQPWDPSVQALVAFPPVLAMFGHDMRWVQRLGDAFLAQPAELMDVVQELRRKARDAGHLESNAYQSVSAETAPDPDVGDGELPGEIILIEPGVDDVVYVPAYDPNEVYGDWYYDDYPPVYYASPYYGPLARGLMWGAGIAIADGLWGDVDWNGGGIDIDVDRYERINHYRLDGDDRAWRHDAANRDGVPYRDRASREHYGRRLDGAGSRDTYRGDDPSRAQARAELANRGIAPTSSNLDAQRQARAAVEQRPALGDRAAMGDTDGAAAADYEARMRRGEIAIAESPADRARAESAVRERAVATERQRERDVAQRRQPLQGNEHARAQARQQHASRQARSSAFDGAGRSSSARQARDRGAHSQRESGRRPSGSGGSQVSRPARAPSRGGGRGR